MFSKHNFLVSKTHSCIFESVSSNVYEVIYEAV